MFKSILVALKFSPAGIQACEKAIRLMETHAANLCIFHALDYRLKELGNTHSMLREAVEEADHRFRSEVQPMLGHSHATGVDFQRVPADPALEVCRLAKTIPADLIVLGCHQPHRKQSMGRIDYIGMTILEKAPCAVMLVPYLDPPASSVGAVAK